jgi:two-component system chemotaxis sensor kinase CheA
VQVDLTEFRAAYLAEVEEHLGGVSAALLVVETANRAGRTSPRELRELMRLLHTIKGLSGMVGVEPIVDIAHRMETVLRTADAAGGSLSERALEAMIRGTRAIEVRVRAVADGAPVPDAPPAILAELDAVELSATATTGVPQASAQGGVVNDPVLAAKLTLSEREQLSQGTRDGKRAVRVDFAPAPSKADRGLTITTVRERLSAIGDLVRVLPLTATATDASPGGLVFALVLLTDSSNDAVAEAAGVQAGDVTELLPAMALAPTGDSLAPTVFDGEPVDVVETQRPGVLRVELARIDDTIEKLSGLIVTRSRLSRATAKLRDAGADTRDLEAILSDNSRQLRDLRAAILHVRMVPIAAVLDRLPLVIRGLGRSTGKQVRLALEGAGAELDKTVAERIFPALVHLLRNAVDHGIEPPEERRRRGKPELATITVSSSSRDNRHIDIRIEDDGRGVDRERVAAKAGRPVPTNDAELLELLCKAGLSTREKVDTTSGRGVGMDIVRRIIVESLGGELTLATSPGRGTTFSVRVPLTIAIVEAFTLRCAGERFVVPVPVVEEIVELDPSTVVRGPRANGAATRFFARRGETVTLIDLASALGLASGKDPARTEQALVVRRGREEPLAFVIDRVLGQQETVVRPLLDPLVAVAGLSGSTDLGDGRPTLVLDLLALGHRRGRAHGEAA